MVGKTVKTKVAETMECPNWWKIHGHNCERKNCRTSECPLWWENSFTKVGFCGAEEAGWVALEKEKDGGSDGKS